MVTPVLRLEEATVRYGARTALQASLTVHEGERVALVGSSGAGKSTVLGLATASRPLTSGTVQVLGEDLSRLSARRLQRLRSRIGTVHQQLDLVGPLAAIHNVGAGNLGRWSAATAIASLIRPRERERSLAAMERLGITHLARTRTDRLSGGEQQRVALARVLVQNPQLVLADEPIASLDPERAREVISLFTRTAAEDGRTLLVSLHDFGIARRSFDRVIGLRSGRVQFDLPADEVTEAHGAELYRLER